MTTPGVRDERPTFGIHPQDPPPKLRHDDRDTLKAYANLVGWLYPGPVGEWIARDLEAIAEFGYRFANPGLLAELLADLDAERERRRSTPRGLKRPQSRRSTPGGTMPAATQTSASGEHRPVPGATGSDGRP